ncbi:MAG: tetratricopeptide repeat protein, partial [Bacteroidota bacterium]
MHSQSVDFEDFYLFYDKENYKESLKELQKIDTTRISKQDKATWYFFYADVQFGRDRHDIAYQYALKAENLFIALDKQSDVIDSKLLRLSIVSHQKSLDFDEQPIIDDIFSYVKRTNDSNTPMKLYFRIGNTLTRNANKEKAIYYYQKILEKTKESIDTAHVYMNIGTVYSTIEPMDQDSALYYAQKAIPILIRHYLALNGRFISFTINNSFNDSIDGLILVDLR